MIEARLRSDTERKIKAVCVVHNETSTGVTSDIAAVRRAIDAALRETEAPAFAPFDPAFIAVSGEGDDA